MKDNKKPLDFSKLSSKKSRTNTANDQPQTMYQAVEVTPSDQSKTSQVSKKKVAPKTQSKRGKKTWKDPNVEYVRLGFDTPAETNQALKKLMFGPLYGKYMSQDEMVNDALNAFIKKHSR